MSHDCWLIGRWARLVRAGSRRSVSAPARAARVSRRVALFTGIAVLGATLGCGSAAEEDEGAVLGVGTQALRDRDDPDGPLEWEGWEPMSEPSVTMGWATPALTSCGGHCVTVFQKSDEGHYWGFASLNPQQGTWTQYATRKFQSSPAAVRFHAADDDGALTIVVGRGAGTTAASRRNYWSTAWVKAANALGVVEAPVRLSNFASINTDSFNDPYGYPGLGARANGDVLMSYINGTSVYVVHKPYTSDTSENNWGSAVQAPALPTNWVPVGVPAVASGYRFGAATFYVVVVRAQSPGSNDRFYRIFFDGTNWRDPFGTPQWKQLTLPSGSMPPIESSPAVEHSPTLATHTVYYRSGDDFYQASFITQQLEHAPQKMVGMSLNPALTSAPSVNGGVPFEAGEHWAIGRDEATRGLHFVQSLVEGELMP